MGFKRTLLALYSLYIIGVSGDRTAYPSRTPTKKPTFGPLKEFYSLPKNEVADILQLTNYARSHVNPSAVSISRVNWNYTMQKDLEAFVQITPKSWWFSDSDNPNIKFNAFELMQKPEFKSKYPGWGYLIHDGCQSSNTGVTRIFRMRAIKQAPYFSYANCRKDVFSNDRGHINNYLTCIKQSYPKVSNKPWSWVWQYYPPLVLENTTEIACALLSQPGPNAAGGNRPNHFFCYRNNATPQINEVPYKSGKAGSECYKKGKKVINKLCV